ncbi:MAG: hypothetical protein PHO83_10140 [Geobacteraceae bacterium]|nr:hypothetical protein [Geobacteraceae bacterium]
MNKFLTTIVTVAAVLTFAGAVYAEEQYPSQEATVTITVTTPDGKVLQEDTVTDTTKGADTTAQYNALQKKMPAEKKETTEKN